MIGSPNKRLKRELRQRVDAIHRAYDKCLRFPSSDIHIDSPVPGSPVPFSLAQSVKQAIAQHRRSPDTDTTKALLSRAQGLAASFNGTEPNPLVIATWATERAEMELSRSLPFDHAVPHTFISGKAYNNYLDPITGRYLLDKLDFSGLHKDDLKALKKLNPTIVDDICQAQWFPSKPCRSWDSDPMRPPAEALALVRNHIIGAPEDYDNLGIQPQTLDSGAALCIGLGFAGSVQALSAMLPNHHVSHIPIPYFLPQYDMDRLTRQTWDMVVLNLPSRHSWQVAQLLSGQPDLTYLQRRSILQGKCVQGLDPTGHVPELVELVHRFLKSGTQLVLLGDPEPFHATRTALQPMLGSIPTPSAGSTNRPVWIDYKTPQWAPHQIPCPTGKLVSIWRVK